MDLGFIGLGNIGGPCAGHLVEAGHRVAVFDIDEDAAARLAEAGARGAPSAAEVAAASEAVLLSLPIPEASEAVVAGEDGLLAAGRSGPAGNGSGVSAPLERLPPSGHPPHG